MQVLRQATGATGALRLLRGLCALLMQCPHQLLHETADRLACRFPVRFGHLADTQRLQGFADGAGEAATLRSQFYSTDDPYVRDSKVKPQWDRALAELEEARRRAEAGPAEVEAFLEEGRRVGALPGWLRDGVELEPVPVLETSEGVEMIEPVVSDEPPPAP